jgi:hypothetical protein
MAGTSFLDAGSLAAIRQAQADGWATQLALSGQTCTIQRPTQTRNAVTGYVESYTTVASVACVVAPSGLRPQDQQVGAALRAQTAAQVRVPAGTDVRKDDRIRDAAGVTYEVVGQPIPIPNAATLTVAVVATT